MVKFWLLQALATISLRYFRDPHLDTEQRTQFVNSAFGALKNHTEALLSVPHHANKCAAIFANLALSEYSNTRPRVFANLLQMCADPTTE